MPLSRRQFLASLAGLASFAGKLSFASPPAKTYALAGNIFTGRDSLIIKGHAVLIRDGRIEDVAPARTVTDRPVFNHPDATILPGVINAHCHRIHTPADRKTRWLRHGVTSIGDPGAPLKAMDSLAQSPAGATATASFSGPMLAPPGGYPLPVHSPEYGLVVRSPLEARDAVKRLADKGATMIKLAFEPGVLPKPWPMLDRATAAAACRTARKLGLSVRCHVQDLSGLQPALDAGVHTIDHVPHRWIDNGSPRPVLNDDGTVIRPYRRLLERMAHEGVILTPTLDVLSRSIWNGPPIFEPVRTFHEVGGRIAAGNDYPYRRTEAGMMENEFKLLAEAGLKGDAVLRAATNDSAAACGFTDRGVIAPGHRADLLIAEGDPVSDPTALSAPLRVIKDGVFVN